MKRVVKRCSQRWVRGVLTLPSHCARSGTPPGDFLLCSDNKRDSQAIGMVAELSPLSGTPKRKLRHRVTPLAPASSSPGGTRVFRAAQALPQRKPRGHLGVQRTRSDVCTFRETKLKIISMETVYSDFPMVTNEKECKHENDPNPAPHGQAAIQSGRQKLQRAYPHCQRKGR